ncbi:MAG TPA: hypothetical protein VGK86_04615 [Thermoanaerobaculia bacterium]|jgi:hypothetical protein
MRPGASVSEKLRRGLAAALLVVVAASMLATLRPGELKRRWHLLARSVSGERISPGEGTGFWFDRDYAVFLEEVRRRTQDNATVAVLAPPWPDVYAYQAAYQLAPRRVVDARRSGEASFVAAYRIDATGAPGAIAIPHGTLSRR